MRGGKREKEEKRNWQEVGVSQRSLDTDLGRTETTFYLRIYAYMKT